MMKKGLTLLELVVALAIFSIATAIIFSYLFSVVRAQRTFFALRAILDETSYVLEYMSRSLRMAQREPDKPFVYEISSSETSVEFFDYQGIHTKYEMQGNMITKTSSGITSNLTSPSIAVKNFKIKTTGAAFDDALQPKITIFFEVSKPNLPIPVIVQMTVSQRNLDVYAQ